MKYISAKQYSARWEIAERTVRRYCESGQIIGAQLVDGYWIIPADTPKPSGTTIDPLELRGPARQVFAQREKNNHYGIYEYLQVNLAYSSSRMASNRLTRNQVIELYRTGKISVAFEPMKVDDIYEIDNHFCACAYAVDILTEPLRHVHLRDLHSLLFYGTKADRSGTMRTGELRTQPHKYGTPPNEIHRALTALLKDYESKRDITLEDILDFHVRFERIHPFDDGNGRLGRLIMMKECLRHQIVPFIIDDKQRGKYHRGIAMWDSDPSILTEVATHAQSRFNGKMDLCRLFQYQRPPRT